MKENVVEEENISIVGKARNKMYKQHEKTKILYGPSQQHNWERDWKQIFEVGIPFGTKC